MWAAWSAAAKALRPAEVKISLEEARARSSNPSVTTARFHTQASLRALVDDYDVQETVLGQGCNGAVVLARGRVDGRPYALKQFDKAALSRAALAMLKDEVEIYLTLDHPHIVRLCDVYESKQHITLLMECCSGGELFERLDDKGRYTEPEAAEAARQMLRAVGFLHSHGIVHRDLKLENWLYESEGADAVLKLIDFGFAKIWDPQTLMMAACGSIDYVSPDVLLGTGYTSKCDLWSMGVIVFMLLSGDPPFHGCDKKTLIAKIKQGEPDWSKSASRWRSLSQDAKHFTALLLEPDPDLRPDAHTALSHPWLTQTLAVSRAKELDSQVLRSLKSYAMTSRVRRAVLQLLAQELAPDESRELRDLFLQMDHDSTGTITVQELKDAIRGCRSFTMESQGRFGSIVSPCISLKKSTPSRSRTSSTTEHEEASWSTLSFGRQISLASSWSWYSASSHVEVEKVKTANVGGTGFDFQGEDDSPPSRNSTDGSPTTPASPGTLMRRAPSTELEDLFDALDANGDEQIYYSDFLAATMEVQARLREEAVRRTFFRLDADGSGTIGVNDLRDAFGETFEGVDIDALLMDSNVTLDGRGEVSYEAFVDLVESSDVVPTPKRLRFLRQANASDSACPYGGETDEKKRGEAVIAA